MAIPRVLRDLSSKCDWKSVQSLLGSSSIRGFSSTSRVPSEIEANVFFSFLLVFSRFDATRKLSFLDQSQKPQGTEGILTDITRKLSTSVKTRNKKTLKFIGLIGSHNQGCRDTVAESKQGRRKVGFIGLGNMGFHMASNLINAGYEVTVHDINYNATKKFLEKGITAKETPLEVAESSDVIITMLPSPSHVLDVYTGQNGLLHGGAHLRPWLFIDSSTVDPQTSRKLSTNVSKCILKEKKGNVCNPFMLDAPVSGGVPGAEGRTLAFMVGGLEEAYLAAQPLFLSMGKNAVYCGGSGNGAAAKICNNLALGVSMLGVSEAFALGQSLGITAGTLTSVFNSSSARCWSSDTYNPVPGVMTGVPSSRNYDGGFSSKLMYKDLALAMVAAAEVGLKCPFTSEAHQIYKEMCEKGYESKDFSCVFRHYYSGKDEI